MFDQFRSRLYLEGEVETLTAIRIGAGRSTSPISADLPVVRDAANAPYIPGSSFKGVLRAYVESIMRGLSNDRRFACNLIDETQQCITRTEMDNLRKQRRDQNWNDRQFSTKILDQTCLICQLFGAPWYASKVHIRDLYVQRHLWFDQYQQRDGVAIDRDTETASDSKLYDYEVVPAGILFDFHAIVDNAEEWQLGLLYLGLSAFENGDLTIGGGSSRGLGLIDLSLTSECYIDSTDIIKHLTDENYDGKPADRQPWIQKFQDKLQQKLEEIDAQTNCQPGHR